MIAGWVQVRATRPDMYQGNVVGRSDPSARQGHYSSHPTWFECVVDLRRRFPGEKLCFQIWDNGPEHGQVVWIDGVNLVPKEIW
jgi:hypothetical protein